MREKKRLIISSFLVVVSSRVVGVVCRLPQTTRDVVWPPDPCRPQLTSPFIQCLHGYLYHYNNQDIRSTIKGLHGPDSYLCNIIFQVVLMQRPYIYYKEIQGTSIVLNVDDFGVLPTAAGCVKFVWALSKVAGPRQHDRHSLNRQNIGKI